MAKKQKRRRARNSLCPIGGEGQGEGATRDENSCCGKTQRHHPSPQSSPLRGERNGKAPPRTAAARDFARQLRKKTKTESPQSRHVADMSGLEMFAEL